ncbi:hypothetical protein Unana1_06198 [Umbelopsis nana]
MSHNSGDIKLPLNDSQSDRLSLMETDEDFLATSQELPPPKLDYCVECKDQEASIFCEQCDEDFCEVCHGMLHRTGNRRRHTAKSLKTQSTSMSLDSSYVFIPVSDKLAIDSREDNTSALSESSSDSSQLDGTVISSGGATFGEWMIKRSKYVPLRLDAEERTKLRLLEAALNVSEYTDKVDIISYTSKSKRIVTQIKDFCAILSGLVVAGDYKLGQELFSDRAFNENEQFFQSVFEVGRRHKIMNPEKMRSSYGKMIYLLMDSVSADVQDLLGFSCVIPIKTVYSLLKERESLELLHDDSIALATREVISDGKSRAHIDAEIKRKEKAIEHLCETFQSERISKDEIKRCLQSLSDNHAFLRGNRDPCEKMLKYLSKYFSPAKAEPGYSLAISAGRGGHRLTHNHATQFAYVHQTLNLWREILHEMFMLWSLSDEDLLSSNPYRLTNTGQGLHRIQSCPNVGREMHRTLHRAQKKSGSWIGSSVIHLGDKNVANAFMFIDKYNQVARILNPIVLTLDKLEDFSDNDGLAEYVQGTFGGVEQCRKDILLDFFRSAFDGSGADNFFDAGSCIDGRLTSAWNWCSQIEKKSYFPMFLLTGFVGFDGGGWN